MCECVWVYPSHVHTPTHGHTHTWLQNTFEEYRGFNRRKGVNHFHLRLGIQTNKYIGLLKITEEKQCKVLLRLHNEVFYMRTKITRIIIMIMSVTLPKKTKECNLNNKNATCVWNTHKHIKKKKCVLILSSLSTIGIYLSVYWFPYFLNMFYLNILNRH